MILIAIRSAALWTAGLLLVIACLGHSAGAQQPAPTERHHLFYIGLALFPEMWSENDVVELAEALRPSSTFDVVPLIASNLAAKPRRYPIADDATIARLVRTAAERVEPEDMVFVHISTHGAPGLLVRQIGNRAPTAITAAQLARKLAPLGPHRTVIILSACYAGSLIPALQTPRRIIITAARADRSSFGCSAESRHTLFGEAELGAFTQPFRSLRDIVGDIRAHVRQMERQNHDIPSEPQVSVGREVMELYDASIF